MNWTAERENSFDFARVVAASGVLISHHFAINGKTEPNIGGVTLGFAAVMVFFFMSGYLLSNSLQKNNDITRFVTARILRILPNLIFVLFVTSVFTLISFHNYENIFDHVRYVAQNILMIVQGSTRFDIRGVFEGRPYTAVNGSLWTLPYEVWCYIILLLIFVGFRSTQIRIAIYALIVAALAAWTLAQFKVPLTGFEVSYFGKLAAFFYIGALFAVHAIKPPLLSSRRMHWFSKGGDPSYGMYIFAWPIQQYCSIWIEGFWTSMAAAFLLTMLTGYFTWHVFERRCIQSVGSVAAMVRQKFSFAYRANRSI